MGNKMKAMTSTYHLKMKLLTEHRVEEVKGDQVSVSRCYLASLKDLQANATLVVGEVEMRNEKTLQQIEPVEEFIDIHLGEDPSRTMLLGSRLEKKKH